MLAAAATRERRPSHSDCLSSSRFLSRGPEGIADSADVWRGFQKLVDRCCNGGLISIADLKESHSLHSGDLVRPNRDTNQHATMPPAIAIGFASGACLLPGFQSAWARHDVMQIPQLATCAQVILSQKYVERIAAVR